MLSLSIEIAYYLSLWGGPGEAGGDPEGYNLSTHGSLSGIIDNIKNIIFINRPKAMSVTNAICGCTERQ